MTTSSSLVFGPLRSRRLGMSLGINNIPAKTCTYSCVYCQVGRTDRLTLTRQRFHDPAEVADAVGRRVREAREAGIVIDYLTFVPDGEPTLDAELAEEIDLLRTFDLPIAVISNASLLADRDVREVLGMADLVSLKVDSVAEECWRRICRPHGGLELEAVLDGVTRFAASHAGTLLTETMLVDGLCADAENMRATARFIGGLSPAAAYLSVPLRPPAEQWVKAPPGGFQAVAHGLLAGEVRRAEIMGSDVQGELLAPGGDPERNLPAVAAVHPVPEAAALSYLERTGSDPALLEKLVADRAIRRVKHLGKWFFVPARSGDRPGKDAETPDADPVGNAPGDTIVLERIGVIETPWKRLEDCPSNTDPSGPECRLVLKPSLADSLDGLDAGDRILVLYWLGLADRTRVVQQRMGRGPLVGTFSTRSPHRPNPVGVAAVVIERIEGGTVTVRGLDCVDGTPLLDVKPALEGEP